MAVCKELTWNILKESWLRGKSVVEQAGRAMGMTAALREFEKSILITWESFTGSGLRFQCTKSHHTQTSWCYSYCIPNIKPLLNQRQCQTSVLSGLRKKRSGLLLSLLWDKSKFWILFANQGPWRKNGKIQNPRCLKSSTKSLQSVMICDGMSSAGVGYCVSSSPKSTQTSTRRFLQHFMLTQHLPTINWFVDHVITVFSWPATSLNQCPSDHLWSIVTNRGKTSKPKIQMMKGIITVTWASVTPQPVPQDKQQFVVKEPQLGTGV